MAIVRKELIEVSESLTTETSPGVYVKTSGTVKQLFAIVQDSSSSIALQGGINELMVVTKFTFFFNDYPTFSKNCTIVYDDSNYKVNSFVKTSNNPFSIEAICVKSDFKK